MKQPAVYLMANQRNGTLYVGVTAHLIQRIWQHREGEAEGFTKQYGLKTLVWYEQHETMESAITREKAIKKWNRAWKLALIEKSNPQWLDLWPEITGQAELRHSPAPRHSREGGNPETTVQKQSLAPSSDTKPLDSRLRGNDGYQGETA